MGGLADGCYCAAVTDTVVAEITVTDDDATATEQAVGLLLRELQGVDGLESVARASTAVAPSGARSGPLIELGTLVAVFTAHRELISGVLVNVSAWLRRRGRGRVEVKIGEDQLIIDLATADEQRRITDAFIDRMFPTAS